MADNTPNRDVAVRYVIYEIPSKRPIRQGVCLRREFSEVVRSLERGKERAKIVKDTATELDLTPYDLLLANTPTMMDPLAQANLGFALQGKTAADAITTVDDIETE